MAAHHEVNFEEHIVEQLAKRGWLVGDAAGYDRERALYPDDVIGWIRETQPEKWERLERAQGAAAPRAVLDRLAKVLPLEAAAHWRCCGAASAWPVAARSP